MSFRLEHISVDYPAADKAQGSLRALNDLSFEVEAGQAVCIIGPSGCGKSTLLRLVAGLMRPTAGAVSFDGEPLKGTRRETALILQDYGLFPWKDVYHNAELGLKLRKAPAAQRRQRTQTALEQVGLSEFAHSYPNALSGGMKQRLAIARALAMDVDTLLMDEPLSALDALLREELQNLLLTLWCEKGYTQVLVTHSIEEAVYLGQRIVVMAPRPGRVVACIDNPNMGQDDYRSQEEFFRVCSLVRSALDEGVQHG